MESVAYLAVGSENPRRWGRPEAGSTASLRAPQATIWGASERREGDRLVGLVEPAAPSISKPPTHCNTRVRHRNVFHFLEGIRRSGDVFIERLAAIHTDTDRLQHLQMKLARVISGRQLLVEPKLELRHGDEAMAGGARRQTWATAS